MKGWAAANRAKGGITQYLYDTLKKVVDSIEDSSKGLAKKVTDLETAVGSKDTDEGSLKKRCADIESDVTALEARVKALEDA